MNLMFRRVLNPRTMMWEAIDKGAVAIPYELMPQPNAEGRFSILDVFEYCCIRDRLAELQKGRAAPAHPGEEGKGD